MKRKYTNEELLDMLKNYINNEGIIPKQTDFKSIKTLPSFSVYYKNFGSLKNIYTLLGLDDVNDDRFNRNNYTDKELLDILRRETINHLVNNIYLLSEDDLDNKTNIPHSSIYQRRFGGIKNSYKLIGYNYDYYNKNALENEMIVKYKQLADKIGHTPNSREIDKYSCFDNYYACKTYTEHFGTVYKLQILCGFTPTKMGINRTKNEMIDDLLKLSELIDDTPTARDIDACEFTCSFGHYSKTFGSLESILKIAGFPEDKIKKNYIITKNGTKCFSQYEYRFAKILENNNIYFDKETYYKDVINKFDNKYKFDFIVNYNNLKYYIEIFGIESNNKYDLKCKNKIGICLSNNLPLICFYPKDFWATNNNNLFNLLLDKINNSTFYE